MGAGGGGGICDVTGPLTPKPTDATSKVKRAAWQVPLNMGVGVGMS